MCFLYVFSTTGTRISDAQNASKTIYLIFKVVLAVNESLSVSALFPVHLLVKDKERIAHCRAPVHLPTLAIKETFYNISFIEFLDIINRYDIV